MYVPLRAHLDERHQSPSTRLPYDRMPNYNWPFSVKVPVPVLFRLTRRP